MKRSMISMVGKLSIGLLAVISCFSLGLALAPQASAAGYDRAAAVTYAKKYACNLNTSCRNSAYVNLGGNDCANFVSQAVRAGGIAFKNPAGNDPLTNWFYKTSTNYAAAWVNVTWFNAHFYGRGLTSYKSVTMNAANTAASKGDVYMYDWGKGNSYSHLAMATTRGNFVSFYDSKKKKNYNSVTGGAGNKIAQHSADRDGAPWNWGYHTEANASVRSKMRTIIIHFN